MISEFALQIIATTGEIVGISLIYIELRHSRIAARISQAVEKISLVREIKISRKVFFILFYASVFIVPSIFFVRFNIFAGDIYNRIYLYLGILLVIGLVLVLRSFGTIITYLNQWTGNRGIGLIGLLLAGVGGAIDLYQTWMVI